MSADTKGDQGEPLEEEKQHGEPLLCSECFLDMGLKIDAYRIGFSKNIACPNCGKYDGKKLDLELGLKLTYRFFVRGTLFRCEYGAAPTIQFNEHKYGEHEFVGTEGIYDDIKLIESKLKIGLFSYGPRMWMIGEVEPLKDLQNISTRCKIIQRILNEYSGRLLLPEDFIFRLRVNPQRPGDPLQYDSPPDEFLGTGRLDSPTLPILYAFQDIEGCIHECRVTLEDELYLATMNPERPLKLLDLTELLKDSTTEFESLDMAIHMLFFAAKHSYEISREIAIATFNDGFDGLLYPSYYSQVRNGAIPFETAYGISIRKLEPLQPYARSQVMENICLFGRPVKNKVLTVKCINRLVLKKAMYDYHFGPIL